MRISREKVRDYVLRSEIVYIDGIILVFVFMKSMLFYSSLEYVTITEFLFIVLLK